MDAIAFGTAGWRAHREVVTRRRVRMVAQAVATYLDDAGTSGSLVVGYDARTAARDRAEEIARVLAVNGRDVLIPPRDLPTPAVSWTVRERELAGACMVTASHNPPEYLGVKFIPGDGAPALPEVTEAIEATLAPPAPRPEAEWGRVREVDLVGPYGAAVESLVEAHAYGEAPLAGLHVAYDAMHGSGRGVTDVLLERLGATVTGVRCERDPTFGGVAPTPEPPNLDPLLAAVGPDGADLGVANDGDADRLGVVTPDGYLDANHVFALLYDFLLESADGAAVRTVSTTSLIDRIADARGEAVHETRVGFKWVARAMAEHDALIGGEESGGFSVRGHVRQKDGVLAALLVAAAAAERPLGERLAAIRETHGEIHQDRVSVDCPDDRKAAVLAELGDSLPDRIAGSAVESVTDADGFKVFLAEGSWLLVRPSGTEPKLRIYGEADSEARVAEVLEAGRDLVAPLLAEA